MRKSIKKGRGEMKVGNIRLGSPGSLKSWDVMMEVSDVENHQKGGSPENHTKLLPQMGGRDGACWDLVKALTEVTGKGHHVRLDSRHEGTQHCRHLGQEAIFRGRGGAGGI